MPYRAMNAEVVHGENLLGGYCKYYVAASED